MDALNLYAVQVFSPHGVVGSFFVAAVDRPQARHVAEQWAYDRGFEFKTAYARRYQDPRPVFVAS